MSKSAFCALALALLLAAALPVPASAENCARGGAGTKAPPGTLASPATPCPPPARKPAPQPRAADKKPGTFQDGKTTIYFGGSVRTDIGGRR
jgi:hypothetical protein